MPCDKFEVMRQFAVESPRDLEEGDWQFHFDLCDECNQEWKALNSSLAVYQHLTREKISSFNFVPDWDQFNSQLRKEKGSFFRQNLFRLSMAAAVSGLLILGGIATQQPFSSDSEQAQSTTPVTERINPAAIATQASPPTIITTPVLNTQNQGTIQTKDSRVLDLRRASDYLTPSFRVTNTFQRNNQPVSDATNYGPPQESRREQMIGRKVIPDTQPVLNSPGNR